jgi:CcmD family protein
MNGILFLKAAYVIAWVVYLGYLARMLVRMRAVERELKEVESAGSSSSATATAGVQRQRA